MEKEKTISFSVTEAEADLIYKGLLELPGKYTITLLEKIRSQYIEQNKEPEIPSVDHEKEHK